MRIQTKDRPWDPQRRPAQYLTLEPEVPVIEAREKEEERKGAAAPWLMESQAADTEALAMSGAARVGASMVEPGMLGSGRLAAWIARCFGTGSRLGRLFASGFGSTLAFGLLLAIGLIAGATVLWLLSEPAERIEHLTMGFPGGPSSAIVIDKTKDHSLGIVSGANRGELQWGDGTQEDGQAAQDKPEAPAPASMPQPEVPVPGASQQAPQVPAGERLRDGLAAFSQNGGPVGSGGRLAQESLVSAPEALLRTQALGGLGGGQKLARPARQAMRSRRSVLSVRAERAMGQLKFAGSLSRQGAFASPEAAARQYATDAFEQSRTIGDGAGLGSGIVVPPGSGAPDPLNAPDTPPSVGPASNATPYQGDLDDSKKKDNKAAMLLLLGLALIAAGVVALAMGKKLMAMPDQASKANGKMLMALGAGLIAAGIAALIASSMMKDDAKKDADKIQWRYGQQEQGAIVKSCADQAYANGTDPSQCDPGVSPQVQRGNVGAATAAESGAGFTLRAGRTGAGLSR